MEKISAGTNVFVYPMPVVLAGTMANDRPNFMAVGWISRVNASPPMIGMGIGKSHYTPGFIKENQTFSVNFPDAGMLEKVDYCGIVSGERTDKSEIFDVFYGSLKTAPMIKECSLCLECKLVDVREYPTNIFFVGEIVASYTEERFMSDGKPDIKKMNPLLLTMPDNKYWTVGEYAGKAWHDGKKYMKK